MSDKYLEHLNEIAREDAEGLAEAHRHYGNSCLKRGGVGLFMMLARKSDRIENLLSSGKVRTGETFDRFDILEAIRLDTRAEGIIDDIRDLRRYLMIVEAEARALGYTSAKSTHRDNAPQITVAGSDAGVAVNCVQANMRSCVGQDNPRGFDPKLDLA